MIDADISDCGCSQHVANALSKTAQVVALLSRPVCASVNEIMAVTRWQQRSIRALVPRLRIKGMFIDRIRCSDGMTTYRIRNGVAE